MRILVVNPNTTRHMKETIGAAAWRVASPGTEIIAVIPEEGPAAIEGFYDEAKCVPGLLDIIRLNLRTSRLGGYTPPDAAVPGAARIVTT